MNKPLLVILGLFSLLMISSNAPVPGQSIGVQVRADRDVYGVEFFYDALAPYGDWLESADYGWVWVPANVRPGWRPYTDGRWVYTADYGWMWNSDAEWGWATDHYGRWYYDDNYGWAWVPGTHWAPAWVAWREGDGYVGWAPLPPEVRVYGPRIDIDVNVVEQRVRPYHWCFVRENDFLDPRVEEHIVRRGDNHVIYNRTNNITNYTVINNRIVNRSLDVDRIQKAVNHPIRPVRVHEVGSMSERRRGGAEDEVNIYRPRIEQKSDTRPAPPAQVVQRSRQRTDNLRQRHAQEVRNLEAEGVKVEPSTKARERGGKFQAPGATQRQPEHPPEAGSSPQAPGDQNELQAREPQERDRQQDEQQEGGQQAGSEQDHEQQAQQAQQPREQQAREQRQRDQQQQNQAPQQRQPMERIQPPPGQAQSGQTKSGAPTRSPGLTQPRSAPERATQPPAARPESAPPQRMAPPSRQEDASRPGRISPPAASPGESRSIPGAERSRPGRGESLPAAERPRPAEQTNRPMSERSQPGAMRAAPQASEQRMESQQGPSRGQQMREERARGTGPREEGPSPSSARPANPPSERRNEERSAEP